ncbi:MAG TPA: SDR family oxidoreductase [Opitutaceae bacterium]|jgi:NAD(P)-dependent dehydrogenase (short-subunit alcohol dehydrogenase family)|nr:SDR family oxidoreductase [Opitutaceae bacterium]
MSTSPKVWFISDASSGGGRSLAEEALRRGDSVVAAALDPGIMDSLVRLGPERIQVLQLDVSQEAQVQPAIDAALGRFGRIDVLVGYGGFCVVDPRGTTLKATMETLFNPAKAALAIADAVATGVPNPSLSISNAAARSTRDKLTHLGARQMVASVTGF